MFVFQIAPHHDYHPGLSTLEEPEQIPNPSAPNSGPGSGSQPGSGFGSLNDSPTRRPAELNTGFEEIHLGVDLKACQPHSFCPPKYTELFARSFLSR